MFMMIVPMIRRSLGAAVGTGILLSISFQKSDISELDILFAWLYFLFTIIVSFIFVRTKAQAVPHLDRLATHMETELRVAGSYVELDLYRIVPEVRELVSFVDELSLLGLVWMGGKVLMMTSSSQSFLRACAITRVPVSFSFYSCLTSVTCVCSNCIPERNPTLACVPSFLGRFGQQLQRWLLHLCSCGNRSCCIDFGGDGDFPELAIEGICALHRKHPFLGACQRAVDAWPVLHCWLCMDRCVYSRNCYRLK